MKTTTPRKQKEIPMTKKKPFYRSKKFWNTVSTVGGIIAATTGALPIPPEMLTNFIAALAGVAMSYNVGQGIADGGSKAE